MLSPLETHVMVVIEEVKLDVELKSNEEPGYLNRNWHRSNICPTRRVPVVVKEREEEEEK